MALIRRYTGMSHGTTGEISVVQLSFNNATQRASFGLLNIKARTVTEIAIHIVSVIGTLANRSMALHLYSDANGAPGTLISGPYSLSGVTAGTNVFTGLSISLAADTRYHFVLSNSAAAPATDGFVYWAQNNPTSYAAGVWTNGAVVWTSTDSGTTWAGGYFGSVPYIKFSNGDIEGSGGYYFGSSARIHGTIACGVKFTSPSYSLNVKSVVIKMRRITLATDTVTVALRYGSVVKTVVVPMLGVSSSSGNPLQNFVFEDAFAIPPNTVCYLYMYVTGGSGSTSAYLSLSTIATDAAIASTIQPLFAMGAVDVSTTDVTAGSITWVENNVGKTIYSLIPDAENEIIAAGGGGGLKPNFPQLNVQRW